ncbi:MAG: hypothetical protein FJ295_15685 [Planctomycetes bacterium]|nr:hypothetical protein [Planctomycetota bacterium]
MNVRCEKCAAIISSPLGYCPNCGAVLSMPGAAPTGPSPINPFVAPQSPPPPSYAKVSPSVSEGDATGGLIPYKNPQALIAYYLGLLSGLPLIGFPLGVAAFILGILGLRARRRNPLVKGSVHAWIGIGCGGLFAIFWGLIAVGLIISMASGFK